MRIRGLEWVLGVALMAACSAGQDDPQAGDGVTLFDAAEIVTMNEAQPSAQMVAVAEGRILAVGSRDDLTATYPRAEVDTTFTDKILVPGLIDPHIHMGLSSLQYATKLTPPWAMATPDGVVEGLSTREAFLERVAELVSDAPASEPLIIFGYHNLVHGDLVRADLDTITTELPLIIWHYSSHDFYLNETAIAWAGVTAELHEQFEGVDLGPDGEPTGRIYEDAIPYLMQKMGPYLLAPERLSEGMLGFSALLRSGGVTSVADLGYGIFGRALEDANIAGNWVSPEHSGYRLYLVPEHRAFSREFGDGAVQAVADMLAGELPTPAPVLPQVKFFTDAAFYSQTMRVSPPGYLSGQSEGSEGLWVIQPNEIAATVQPYWEAGYDVRIHSNGDAAQTATLDALEALRESNGDLRFVFEHAGLFSPEQVTRASSLGAGISAASHYVYYLGEAYQGPLGPERGGWISPLASLSEVGVPVTLHSDAPLAPPLPLLAASVHLTRATREGGVLTPEEKLSAQEALEAITVDAAYAMRMEDQIGAIKPGLLADFTVLDANPLDTPGEVWGDIAVWGVVLGGEKRPLE